MGNGIGRRIEFRDLADVKTMISVLIDGFEATVKAAETIARMGVPANSPESTEARERGREYAELLIATYEEFNRLHVDCECPMTEDDVTRAISQLREILADIAKDDERAAGMPAYSGGNPLEALMARLAGSDGAAGIQMVTPDQLMGMIGGKPDGTHDAKFGTDGTGMYL
jgi:hypothetical protein